MVMTQSANSPLPDGKAMLEHVVTVVLKQAKDGLLAKALDAAAVHEINNVLLSTSQQGVPSLSHWMMAQRRKSLLVTGIC